MKSSRLTSVDLKHSHHSIMAGELESTGKSVGRGRRRNKGRIARQRIVGSLTSQGTGAPPHLTLASLTAQYAKGALDLWPRG